MGDPILGAARVLNDKTRSRGDRIARLRRRLRDIAEDDARENVKDPMVDVVRGILDLLADEL